MATKRLGRTIIELGRGKHGQKERSQRNRALRRWKIVDGEYESGPRKGFGVELRDNLSALRRWLGRHVGQSWSKVYAEFTSKIDRRSLQGDHINTHLKGMVYGAGGREYCQWPSEWTPLCQRLGMHNGAGWFINNDVLCYHSNDDCWKWSAERGHPKPKPKKTEPVRAFSNLLPLPKPAEKPKRDPMEVLKERKLERNRERLVVDR